jgi:quinol monooxygenase YgiN
LLLQGNYIAPPSVTIEVGPCEITKGTNLSSGESLAVGVPFHYSVTTHTHKEANLAKYLFLVVAMTLCLAVGVSAQEAMKEPASGGKVVVIVTHEVKDYNTWRKGYEADELNRKNAGFKVSGVYADVKNPNMVSVIGEFPNAAAAEAFTTSPKLKEVMEKAGVIGKPDVKVLTVALK